MKITLFALNSSFTHTNLAIRYLASSLEDAGYECCIKEYTLKDKHSHVLHNLIESSADIYAFSVYIWNYKEMLTYAQELKSLIPDAKIILGGPEVSFETAEFFDKHDYIDTVISGEGEDIIATVCGNISDYIHKIVTAPCSQRFLDEGILYDRFPAIGNILYYESQRGCPHRCSYCLSSLSGRVRAKSIEKTLHDLKEFERLPNKPKIIKFIDRTFNYDLERAKTIWKELTKYEYTLSYHFEITADKLDEECFEIFAAMPKGKIQFEAGIQSTNKSTLKAVNRTSDPKAIIRNLTRIKKLSNIHIHADLIAGLPYEDITSLRASFDQTIACCHKLQLGFLKLLKGSQLRRDANKYGYIFESNPPYKVLSSCSMSYGEMYRAELISDTVERFYCKDNFVHTFEHIISVHPSPFEFFSDLTDRLGKTTDKLSQHECRMILIDMIREDEKAMTMLALDTLIWENKKPPEELQKYYRTVSKAIINSLHEKFNSYDNVIYNIYELSNDSENYYAIDRTNHKYIKLKR